VEINTENAEYGLIEVSYLIIIFFKEVISSHIFFRVSEKTKQHFFYQVITRVGKLYIIAHYSSVTK
jgi:hypothetical protein